MPTDVSARGIIKWPFGPPGKSGVSSLSQDPQPRAPEPQKYTDNEQGKKQQGCSLPETEGWRP